MPEKNIPILTVPGIWISIAVYVPTLVYLVTSPTISRPDAVFLEAIPLVDFHYCYCIFYSVTETKKWRWLGSDLHWYLAAPSPLASGPEEHTFFLIAYGPIYRLVRCALSISTLNMSATE